VLADAGPIVALADEKDPHHIACTRALLRITPPLETILPVFTEAMYLIGRSARWDGQNRLWSRLQTGALRLRELELDDLTRARELMEQYRDVPMDFADATLVAYAEREGLDQIFTLDRRAFLTYRLRGRRPFTIFP